MAENLKREKKKDDVSLFESLFSFNGYLGRLGLLGTLLLIGSVLTFLLEQNNVFLAFLGYFFVLYSGIVAYQKRCRDTGSNGTMVILLYSGFVVFKSCLDYLRAENITVGEIWKMLLLFIGGAYIVVVLFLLLIPGVKEKNPNLTSPLLKKPIIYISICFVILVICRYGLVIYYQ